MGKNLIARRRATKRRHTNDGLPPSKTQGNECTPSYERRRVAVNDKP